MSIVIIGGGLAGTSVAYQAALLSKQHGVAVDIHLLEQHPQLPNPIGSSCGESRITRKSGFEGANLIPPVLETMEICENIQNELNNPSDYGTLMIAQTIRRATGTANIELFRRNGFLMTTVRDQVQKEAHSVGDAVARTIDIAREFSIAHETMDGHEIVKRFPLMKIPAESRSQTVGYYENDSGTLFPETIVLAQALLAQQHGAKITTGAKVRRISQNAEGNQVILEDGTIIKADKIIVCAGAWVNDLLGETSEPIFQAQRQLPVVFPLRKAVGLDQPNFIRFVDGDYFYGTSLGHHVKVATEQRVVSSPDLLRVVYAGEVKKLFNYVSHHIKGMNMNGHKARVCYYTSAPGDKLYICDDRWRMGVYIMSACSGYGAKLLPSLGHAVARQLLELDAHPSIDLADFGWRKKEPAKMGPTPPEMLDLLKRADEKEALGKAAKRKTAGDKPGGPK